MREETRSTVLCAFCKLRITRDQRPSIRLESGDEFHRDCYGEWNRARPSPSEEQAWSTLERLNRSHHSEQGVHSITGKKKVRPKTLRPKVLCIDDNPDVLQVQEAILEGAGYEVLLGGSGAEGLQVAVACQVDLVVLDYEMPELVGTEVARRLRAQQPSLPIIMVSGAELPRELTNLVDCFIPKTEIVSTLVVEVKRLLANRGTARR